MDSGDPAGLCPQCLIQGAFDSSLGADESRTQTIDTAAAAAGDDDFGRYQILRPLGEGGMGTVYLAEQREPIRRCVALKVVKLGMDTSQVLARFANERQALAMMDHPNIARIFDAGATRQGPALLRDGVHRGRTHHAVLRRQADDHRPAAGTVSRGVPRRSARAPEGRDPPRPQAVECAGDGTGGHAAFPK